MLFDTIVAVATSLQEGAISIVRISGQDAIDIASSLCRKDLHEVESHSIHYTMIIDPLSKEDVDEVLVSVFRAPKTFTREDVVEINCHGGVFITKKILSLCLANGARLATPGEFTRRAFLHGRIDLTQAEAINDMIKATHNTNATLAIAGIKGSVKTLIDPLLENLLEMIATIEVNIDYPEYDDIEQISNDILKPRIEMWLKDMDQILKQAQSGKILKEGIKTAIIGRANVGKSSLLNALLEEDKAIVTDIEGTTRDVIEGIVQVGNITLHLLDTAGIRDTQDKVEQIGIERSKKAVLDAQLVILVLDASNPNTKEDEVLKKLTEDKERIIVYNKEDLLDKKQDGLFISAAQQNIDALTNEIEHRYGEHLDVLHKPTLQNERHISLMRKAKQEMLQAYDAIQQGLELDLITIDLQASYNSLKEILGEVHRDDLLDTLFTNFCLGK